MRNTSTSVPQKSRFVRRCFNLRKDSTGPTTGNMLSNQGFARSLGRGDTSLITVMFFNISREILEFQ